MADSPASSVRQRKPNATPETDEVPTTVNGSKSEAKVDDEDAYSPWVDVLRVLTFLFLASCGLSYLISNGESWFWGMSNPPKYLQAEWWKGQFVRRHYVVSLARFLSLIRCLLLRRKTKCVPCPGILY